MHLYALEFSKLIHKLAGRLVFASFSIEEPVAKRSHY